MNKWLKFYFGGFFSDDLLGEASSRSFWNTVLSLILSFLLIWSGLSVGYIASFGRHLSDATDFHRFLDASLGKDNESGVYLTVSDGRLCAEFDNGADHLNTFDRTDGSYRLIVDTRPKETTFDDFSVLCKDANGKEIPYDEYVALSEEQREKSECSIVYSGQALDVAAGLSDYRAYLEKFSAAAATDSDKELAANYAALEREYEEGKKTSEEYANEIYVLYFEAKYPTLSGKDAYGKAPTLRTYYMDLEKNAPDKRYVMLFDDIAMCAFVTDGNVNVDFAGYMNKVDDGPITSREMTDSRISEQLNHFFGELFSSGNALASFVFLFSLTQMVLLGLLAVLIQSLLLFIICKMKRSDECTGFIGAMKTVGATLFIGAAGTALNAVILSFVLSRGAVFKIALILFPTIVTIRLIVFLVGIIKRKPTVTDPAEEIFDEETGN